MKLIIIGVIFFMFFISACKNKNSEKETSISGLNVINKDSSIAVKPKEELKKDLLDTANAIFNDSDLLDVSLFSDKFIFQIRYATRDNFLDTILYPCAKCLLRFEVLKDLLNAEKEFEKNAYRIKLYDCYRPLWVQKLMWEKVPIQGLVANPASGSRHNRGSAVDVSLVDAAGKELDFGTPHDDFSKKAKTFYSDLPDTIIKNRMYLRKIMQKHHFKGINSEWWHFSHNCGTKYKVSNRSFYCDSVN